MTSRQVGKSTLIETLLLYLSIFYQYQRQLYATAEQSHVDVFRRDRILLQLAKGTSLHRYLAGSKWINNRHELRLEKTGSINDFRAVKHNPLSAHGLSVFNIFFDEEQSIPPDALYRTMETASAYPDRTHIMHCGTPGSPQNHFSKTFMASTQCEWIVTCTVCQKDNPPISLENIDINKPYFFCLLCGEKTSPTEGRFLPQNPDGRYPGYRISALMNPQADYRNEAGTGILDKMETYSQDRFITDVLGFPSGSNRCAIPWEKVVACCGEDEMAHPDAIPEQFQGLVSIGTIDWAYNYMEGATAYTVISIWQKPSNDSINCIYMKRFQGSQYFDQDIIKLEIIATFKKFRVGLIGMGNLAIAGQIKRALPDGVALCNIHYTGNSPYITAGTHCYTVNKVLSLDILFSMMKERRIVFPRLTETVESVLNDFSHLAYYKHPDSGRIEYRQVGGPDDFVHCTNYAFQVARKIGPRTPAIY